MKEELIQEIIACLPRGRTKYYYFKDRYALMLLSYLTARGVSIGQIKNSPLKKLVDKGVVKQVLKQIGSGRPTPTQLGAHWPEDYHCYLLTLGQWGDRHSWSRFYNQTSRPGYNLVLQLNFSAAHTRPYERIVKPKDRHPFKCTGHPVRRTKYHTLAWARIDLDLDSGEALIEEIQNDWIRRALYFKTAMERHAKRGELRPSCYEDMMGCDAGEMKRYVDRYLKPHMRIWDEAMLSAVIWFLKEEIGIRRIYYHTHEFGSRLKRIDYRKPPRSIYTKLPERFCFTTTDQVPTFLVAGNNRRVVKLLKQVQPKFFMLDLA